MQFWASEFVKKEPVMHALYTTVCPVTVARVINPKTAKALGITIPPPLLQCAGLVIQS